MPTGSSSDLNPAQAKLRSLEVGEAAKQRFGRPTPTDGNWLSEIPQALLMSFVLSSLEPQANAAPTVTMMMKP